MQAEKTKLNKNEGSKKKRRNLLANYTIKKGKNEHKTFRLRRKFDEKLHAFFLILGILVQIISFYIW